MGRRGALMRPAYTHIKWECSELQISFTTTRYQNSIVCDSGVNQSTWIYDFLQVSGCSGFPEGWTSFLTTCGLNAVRSGVWGSSRLFSLTGHLAASRRDPSCTFFILHAAPVRRTASLQTTQRQEGDVSPWSLFLPNPPPFQGLNDKISGGIWQNGMALFNFKGVCAIIKKVISLPSARTL